MSKKIVKKEIEISVNKLETSYFIFQNNEFIGKEFQYLFSPIPCDNSIGTILIDILNMKETLFKSFNDFIEYIQNINEIEILRKSISAFSENYWNNSFLSTIKYKMLDTCNEYEETGGPIFISDLLEENPSDTITEKEIVDKLIKVFSIYISNIKSIIENFCIYIESNENHVKQYLLWNMEIPKCSIQMGQKNNQENTVTLLPLHNHEYFYEKQDFSTLITVKKYIVSNFVELLNLLIDQYFQYKLTIKKCDNCGKYFITSSRTDEKYCDSPSPQNKNKTCKEYGAKKAYRDKLNSNEARKAHYNTSQFFRMKINRSKKEKEIKLYTKLFNTYKTNYEKQKKKFNNKKISEAEFINWIVEQKGIN